MIKNVALNDIVLELDLKNREYAREDGPVDPMHNAKKNLHVDYINQIFILQVAFDHYII